MTPQLGDWKPLTLKRDGICTICALALRVGSRAMWSATLRNISCVDHADMGTPPEDQLATKVTSEPLLEAERSFSQGTAGGSARAENVRRIKKREARITARFPRAGKYILALTDEPQSTKAWEVGSKGEVAVGKLLDFLAIKYGFQVLHDRLIPKSRANIDHLAITKYGVFIIDAKNYQGVVRVKDSSGFFDKSAPELWVGKRNCTKLVAGVKKQTSIVEELLRANSIGYPVSGVLAFYAADWGSFKFLRTQLEVDGVLINNKRLEAIVSREGSLSAQEINTTTLYLATKLVSAT